MKDPVEFVQQLLTQKDKFDAIVSRSFQNDKTFQNALNQVCVAQLRSLCSVRAVLAV